MSRELLNLKLSRRELLLAVAGLATASCTAKSIRSKEIKEPTSTPTPEDSREPFYGNYPLDVRLTWPAKGMIAQGFSPTHPWGIDIDCCGKVQLVRAAADGIIKQINTKDVGKGLGLYIVVNHIDLNNQQFETVYGHLGGAYLIEGKPVQRGERIGLMGLTGYTTGVHLHFGVRTDKYYLNPLHYLENSNEVTDCKDCRGE